jgi:hypothetical protein
MRFQGPTFTMTETELVEPRLGNRIARTGRIEHDTLVMESEFERRLLKKSALPANGPQLETGNALVDWAFLIARRDLESNFYDGGIHAGANFQDGATWIRDTSYTALMGLNCFYPAKLAEVLPNLLNAAAREIMFEQYHSVFEDRQFSMTDQILWLLAAEKLARVQGDNRLLRYGIPFAMQTISRMLQERLDTGSFVFAGGSSLFDGHTGFPMGFTGPLLKAVSNNFLYMRALKLLAALDDVEPVVRRNYTELHQQLRRGVDQAYWLETQGYYAQLEYDRNYREERFETLGNILALADPDVDRTRAVRIAKAMPAYAYGVPALYPWYKDRVLYHSEGIWPFMMGLTLWALHERRDDTLTRAELADTGADLTYIAGQLLRTSMLEGTFMELLDCKTGEGLYSPAQVWSAAAMLALVEHGLFGMRFERDGLVFKPNRPDFLRGAAITLHQLAVRGKNITLTISPEGNVLADGRQLPDNTLRFADFGIPAGTWQEGPIATPEKLTMNARPEERKWEYYAQSAGPELSLILAPGEQMIFPATEQIGSYAFEIKLKNLTPQPQRTELITEITGTGLTVQPEKLAVEMGAQETVTRLVRVTFTTPPVHLTEGRLTVKCQAVGLSVSAPIKRLLTLDLHWRYKPMFKQRSLGYGRDYTAYDTWDLLRAPMRAEQRLGAYTGILWYAHKVLIPVGWQGKDLFFYCGAMSEWDITYCNGTEIGRTGDAQQTANGQERKYRIPADLIRYGALNYLAVKTWCAGKNCGMWKGPLFLAPPEDFDWAKRKAQRVIDSNQLPPLTDAPEGMHLH